MVLVAKIEKMHIHFNNLRFKRSFPVIIRTHFETSAINISCTVLHVHVHGIKRLACLSFVQRLVVNVMRCTRCMQIRRNNSNILVLLLTVYGLST